MFFQEKTAVVLQIKRPQASNLFGQTMGATKVHI